jgi:hypothetical protein
MTQEERDILLKDICARLPYNVKAYVKHWSSLEQKYYEGVYDVKSAFPSLNEIHVQSSSGAVNITLGYYEHEFKPYLFPLSSMTEEQFNELKYFAELNYETDTLELVEWENNYKTLEFWLEEVPSYCVIKVFDWLNKNHFDYRGLIEKGLALDATGLNIY